MTKIQWLRSELDARKGLLIDGGDISDPSQQAEREVLADLYKIEFRALVEAKLFTIPEIG